MSFNDDSDFADSNMDSGDDFSTPLPPEVGEIKPEDFDFEPGVNPPPPARKPFPWKLAATIGGIVAVVGLVIAGIFLLAPGLVEPSPATTVEQYYTAWQANDFKTMSELQDPTSQVNAARLGDYLLSGIKSIFGDVNIDIQWKFSDLSYKVLSNDHKTAKVEVDGNLHFTALGMIDSTRSYQKIHELIKINGKWYVKP